MKHIPHFAPRRERRYPVLTAIDLMLYWTLSAIAFGLTALAVKMMLGLILAHPAVQIILSRIA